MSPFESMTMPEPTAVDVGATNRKRPVASTWAVTVTTDGVTAETTPTVAVSISVADVAE